MLATLTVSLNVDGGITDDGNLLLREAIAYVNGIAPGPADLAQINLTEPFGQNDKIVFTSSLNAGTINLAQALGDLDITASVNIDASMLTGGLTLQAHDPTPTQKNADGSRVFNIALSGADQSVTLDGLTLTGGDTTDEGGGIKFTSSSGGVLRLDNSTVMNNSASDGGGIYAQISNESQLRVANSVVSGNTSMDGGAPLFGSGGGMAVLLSADASLVVEDSQVMGNQASYNGGGILARARQYDTAFPTTKAITISRSLISGNTAGLRGGGIHTLNYAGTETLVEDSRFTDNHALDTPGFGYGNGGGIYGYLTRGGDGTTIPAFTLSGCTVDNNSAVYKGGGVFFCGKDTGNFVAINSTISGNKVLHQTEGRGGGIFIGRFNTQDRSVDAYLTHLTVTQNSGQSGGGVETENLIDVRVRIANSIISENYSDQSKTTPNNLKGPVVVNDFLFNLLGSGSQVLDHDSGMAAVLDPIANILANDAPGLAPLANNGGFLLPDGSTILTHALLTTSPARDSGNPTAVAGANGIPMYDERGANFTRVYGGRIDIGAYEYDPPPQVINVRISGSASTHDPFDFNGPNDAADSDGSGIQLYTVPVGAADTVSIQFSEEVTGFTPYSLLLYGLTTAAAPVLAEGGFSYDDQMATWRFNSPFTFDQYVLSLSDAITDLAGNKLDGEWINPFSLSTTNALVSEFPSGDGAAGGRFSFVFTILPGDAYIDNVVDGIDESFWFYYYGQPANSIYEADFDGNGSVDTDDYLFWLANEGVNLSTLIYADFNHDGTVDELDYDIWSANYGTSNGHAQGDANHDGWIDTDDVLVWLQQIHIGLKWVA